MSNLANLMTRPTSCIPTIYQSFDEEHNLPVWKKVYLMESGFSRKVERAFEGQTRSLGGHFPSPFVPQKRRAMSRVGCGFPKPIKPSPGSFRSLGRSSDKEGLPAPKRDHDIPSTGAEHDSFQEASPCPA